MTNKEFDQIKEIINGKMKLLNISFEEAAVSFIDELIPTLDCELIMSRKDRKIYWNKLKSVMKFYLK